MRTTDSLGITDRETDRGKDTKHPSLSPVYWTKIFDLTIVFQTFLFGLMNQEMWTSSD